MSMGMVGGLKNQNANEAKYKYTDRKENNYDRVAFWISRK